MPHAFIIGGPTSSGKSEIALAVAEQLGGEIVNADSRQIYRGLSIGTGMPSQRALERVPHHLYAFVDPAKRYSAARYVSDAAAAVDDIAARGRIPIVVGGTGFYIEALTGTMPLDRPPGDEALRARLRREATIHPAQALWDWLAALSPARAAQTRSSDSYRILRALEGALIQRTEPPQPHVREARRPINACAIFVLRAPRSVLRARIAQRVADMFDRGLIDEARSVRARAPFAPALSGLGYAQALDVLDGLSTASEALAATIRRTEHYAKRQETWFRRIRTADMVDAEDPAAATRAIVARARERLAHA
ncbi:MAG: tRNA (adenosine(37)-N6)-dimethylallyltransferase MiaA [Candidatus Eremiobacteraeota bacterium]|nr:tRNA (adenosine(37)-N6)-dimethylallyltransferase MiaA [Candidatus Eremiobacteraeota bacterium]